MASLTARTCLAVLGVCLVVACSACTPGNNGSLALAFVRAGALWTIQPNGSTLFQVAGSPVIGFAWSPDHHEFVARFAALAPYPTPSLLQTDAVADFNAILGVVSIDGGDIKAITPPNATPPRSDAWWNARGNRLIYREQGYWVQSQSDQPSGIARKYISVELGIPATAPDGSLVAQLATNGDVLIGAPAAATHAIAHGALLNLPASPWPARILWQPLHQAVLYAVSGTDPTTTTLLLSDLQGHQQVVTTVSGLQQYCWSPAGDKILIETLQGYMVHTVAGGADVHWNAVAGDEPWWSPDGRSLVLIGPTHVALVDVNTGTQKLLAQLTPPTDSTTTDPQALPHPATGSPWSPDGKYIAFVAVGGQWLGGGKPQQLATHGGDGANTGIYVIALAQIGANAGPALADWGEHRALSWSTPDPNTQILVR